MQKNNFADMDYSPEATWDPQRTGSTGDALASALLGLPARIQGNVPDYGFIDFHTETLSGYFQDQWSIKPNLTLTYGLRYDYITRAVGAPGTLQSGPDMDTGEWLIAQGAMPPVCATVGNVPPCLPKPLDQIPFNQYIKATGEEFSILPTITDNFGPRVGVAWQANPQTVVRAGYSLMWDSMVSRSQYGQHQMETWGWPQFSASTPAPGSTRRAARSLGSRTSTICRSACLAPTRGRPAAGSTTPTARTPTPISGTSRSRGRSRAT
jgi:hypothetical protein